MKGRIFAKGTGPLIVLLLCLGGIATILLPFSPLSQNMFVDENAFSDGVPPFSRLSQADLDDIHKLERQMHSSADIREWVKNTFMGIGLETHEFQYNTDNDRNGDENDSVGIVYGIHRADRTDGKESMVLVVEYTQVAQPAYRTCSPGKEHAQPSGSPPPLSLEFDPDTHSPSGLTLAVGLLSYLSSSRVNWLARDIILVAVENKFNEQKHYHHQQRHHQNYDHRHDEDPPEGCGWKDKIPLFHSREEASVLSQKAVHEWVQAYFHPPSPASSPSPSPSPSFRPTVATGAGASASGLYQRHQRQQIAHAGKMLFAVSLDIPVFTPTFDSVSLHVNGDYGLLPNYDAVSVLIKCLARQKYTVQISDFPPPASTSFPPPASSPSSSPSKPTPPTSAEYVPPFTDMSVFVAPYLHRLLGWLHTHLKDLEPRFIKPETEAKIVESLKGFSRFMVNTATEQHTGYHAPFLNNNIDALTIQHGYHIEATHTSTQEECRHNEHSDSNDQGATGDRGSDFACRGLGGVHLQRVPAFLSPNAARHSSLRLLQGLEHYTRVFNNLIEKLHHANFFYVLVDHNTFTLINNYFIAGVLVFLPLMLSFFQLVFLHHHRFTACDVLSSLSVLAGIYCGLGWCCVLVCPLLATIAQPSTAFASTSISLPSSSSWLEVGNEMLAIITSVISHAVATTASLLNVPPGVMEETLAFSPPSFVSPMTALLALPPSPFSFPLSLLSMLTSSFSPPSPSSSNPSSLISASSAASLSSAFQERAASLSPLLSWVLGLALLSGLVLTVLQVLVCRRLCWYQLPKFWSTYTIIGSEKEVGRIEEESEYTRGKEIVTKGEPEGGQKRGKESDRGEDKTNENIMGVKKEQNSGTHESEAKYNCTYPPTVSATPASSTTPVPMPALRTFDWRCLKAMVMFMLLIVFGALMFFSFQLAIITMSALVPLVLVAAPLSKYCVCRAVPSSPLSSPSSPPTQPRITHHIVSMLFAWICGILTCTLLILLSPPALLVLYAHANALGLISAVHEVCVLLATSSKLAVLVLWFLYLPVYFVSLLITLAPVSVDVKHTMSKQ